jgi:hypothetical protein
VAPALGTCRVPSVCRRPPPPDAQPLNSLGSALAIYKLTNAPSMKFVCVYIHVHILRNEDTSYLYAIPTLFNHYTSLPFSRYGQDPALFPNRQQKTEAPLGHATQSAPWTHSVGNFRKDYKS